MRARVKTKVFLTRRIRTKIIFGQKKILPKMIFGNNVGIRTKGIFGQSGFEQKLFSI
jgi:hypothetical protein